MGYGLQTKTWDPREIALSAATIRSSEESRVVRNGKTPGFVTDNELVAQIQKSGDEEAFNLLYDRYLKRVYGFISRRMGNRADVEEATQEVFINILSSLDSFRGEGPFAAWVFGVSRRVVANRFKRKRHPTVPLLDEDGDEMNSVRHTETTPLDEYECAERFEQMTESMNRKLSEEQRILFRMHHLEDRPISEIARALKKSEDAIKSNLYRARRLLLIPQ